MQYKHETKMLRVQLASIMDGENQEKEQEENGAQEQEDGRSSPPPVLASELATPILRKARKKADLAAHEKAAEALSQEYDELERRMNAADSPQEGQLQPQPQPRFLPQRCLATLPDVFHFICPLTHRIMHDPVVAADGHTYERAAIEAHFARHGPCSPFDARAKLHSTALVPNHNLKSQINLRVAITPNGPSEPCFVDLLSTDVLLEIFYRLPAVAVTRAAQVCKLWRDIIRGSDVWCVLLLRHFPLHAHSAKQNPTGALKLYRALYLAQRAASPPKPAETGPTHRVGVTMYYHS
eukprot:TRINITY_DN4513_c0_g1_i1.p1 TRINITY_DN4513_c0_g1~~TRINITY_DN4513_c0_g1_i1.p1  ORF type:complete len:295 (-),score=68.25 TRINITY_DN4513_c0_g1_i1:41-925(-)